jgi:hypothetical protein
LRLSKALSFSPKEGSVMQLRRVLSMAAVLPPAEKRQDDIAIPPGWREAGYEQPKGRVFVAEEG